MGESWNVKSYNKFDWRHEVSSDDPTADINYCTIERKFSSLRTGVVPPVPKPVESYIVARNSRPAGALNWNVCEYGCESPLGMVMFRIRPEGISTV